MTKIAYGPVQSLRYGLTLGVNILGDQKVCSFDCGYCDLGPTQMTLQHARKEYVFPNIDQIVSSVRDAVSELKSEVLALVVSGNGEPTLHPDFDEVIKALLPLRHEILLGRPLIVLTNGAHLDSKKVISGLNEADERVVKLDAGSDNSLKAINSPLVRTGIAKIIDGIKKLKDCHIQSMFVCGEADNTTPERIDEWIEVMGIIKPKSVQLMTLTRQPAQPGFLAVEEDVLYSIAHKLKKRTQLEANVYSAK